MTNRDSETSPTLAFWVERGPYVVLQGPRDTFATTPVGLWDWIWSLPEGFQLMLRTPEEMTWVVPARPEVMDKIPTSLLRGWESGFEPKSEPDMGADSASAVSVIPQRPGPRWSAFHLVGPFSFEVVGILAGFLAPLAAAGIPILGFSSFETDHVFVPYARCDRAVQVLQQAGYRLLPTPSTPE